MSSSSFTVLLVSLMLLGGCGTPNPALPRGNHSGNLASAGARIIDVRSPKEYDAGHLVGAINIPHDQIGQKITQLTTNKSEPLLVHCQSGRRSAIAKATLQAEGYTKVIDLGSFDNARLVTGK